MLSVIVPVHNEEKTLGATLNALLNQNEIKSRISHETKYSIIVVLSKKSTDTSIDIVKSYQNKFEDIYLVRDDGNGIVDARLKGIDFSLKHLKSKYIAFCDADLIVPNNWINTIFYALSNQYDVVSFAGSFPLEFWKAVPKLTNLYYKKVGTIFFNEETINYFNFSKSDCLFSDENVFGNFQRPLSGGCYAITVKAYLECGGYIKEYRDEEKRFELDGPTWRMMFRLYQFNPRIYYYKVDFFSCSPRRLLANPYEFFSVKTYDQMNILENYRDIPSKQYEIVNELADNLDLNPVVRYVVQYYILIWLIVNPDLIKNSRSFFFDDNIYTELISEIDRWKKINKVSESLSIFNFSKDLTDKYMERIVVMLKSKKEVEE
jgi:glycosyltransferase involved in cell wall biosynthesis